MRSIVYIVEYLSLDNIIRPLNAKHNQEREREWGKNGQLNVWRGERTDRKKKRKSQNIQSHSNENKWSYASVFVFGYSGFEMVRACVCVYCAGEAAPCVLSASEFPCDFNKIVCLLRRRRLGEKWHTALRLLDAPCAQPAWGVPLLERYAYAYSGSSEYAKLYDIANDCAQR